MKYLTSALILIGAFFSLTTKADDFGLCDPGEIFDANGGRCGIPAPEDSCPITQLRGTSFTGVASPWFPDLASYTAWLSSFDNPPTMPACHGSASGATFSHNLTASPSDCPSSGSQISKPYVITRNSTTMTNHRENLHDPNSPCHQTTTNTTQTHSTSATIRFDPTEAACPDSHPLGPEYYDDGVTMGHYCWRSPPCDCSNLQGSHAGTFDGSFVDYEGQYSQGNPPPCVNVTDYSTGQQCPCGVVSNMWHATPVGASSTLRWTPFGGTFTGASCGEEDTGPGDRETCFTLQDGTQWCLGDPNMDCQVINGMQQCRQGCGYFNDDFVCYDIDDPGTPDPDDIDQNPIDDNISDPNKPIEDMVKGDFKDVQRGTEQRLDNINISLGNQNNRIDGTNRRLDQANSKLDGIGRQLDGMGKELKGIGDTLGDAFGDDGEGPGDVDGTCTDEGICSWYESAYPDGLVGIWQEHSAALQQTAMFEFLNQFTLSPSGSQPDFGICFNLGPLGDFGCHNFDIPAIIWSFIFICIQITAVFLCRRLIFGG